MNIDIPGAVHRQLDVDQLVGAAPGTGGSKVTVRIIDEDVKIYGIGIGDSVGGHGDAE